MRGQEHHIPGDLTKDTLSESLGSDVDRDHPKEDLALVVAHGHRSAHKSDESDASVFNLPSSGFHIPGTSSLSQWLHYLGWQRWLNRVGDSPNCGICPAQVADVSDDTTDRSVRVGWGQYRLQCWVPGSTIRFYFDRATFGPWADMVHSHLIHAVRIWTQAPGIGIILQETQNETTATFRVTYRDSHQSVPGRLAIAFCPNANPRDRTIYLHALSLSKKHRVHLSSTIAHELGHVFGLRHEFIEKGKPSVHIGPANSASIMDYPDWDDPEACRNWVVTGQDLAGLREFMSLDRTKDYRVNGDRYTWAEFYPANMAPGSHQVYPGDTSRRSAWAVSCCFM